MEGLYHSVHILVGIFPYIGLKNRPYIWQVPPIQVPGMAIDVWKHMYCLRKALEPVSVGLGPTIGNHEIQRKVAVYNCNNYTKD